MTALGHEPSLRRQRGTASVEMAIAVPVLLFVVLATAEIGRAFVQYTALSNAVRDGARYAASNALNGSTGVINISNTLITATRNVVMYGTATAGAQPILPSLAANHITVARAGSDVAITAAYPYQSILGGTIPGFGGGTGDVSTAFTLRIYVRMRPI